MTRYVLRPCWAAGLTWLLIALLCPWLSARWRVALMAVSATVLIVSLLVPAVRRIHAISLTAAVCLLATAAFHMAYLRRVQPIEACIGQPVSLDVQVIETGSYVLLEVQEGELPEGTQIRFYPTDPELALQKHDRFQTTFVLESYDTGTALSLLMRRASGVWLQTDEAAAEGIAATLTEGTAPWTEVFVRIREHLVSDVERQLDGDIGAVVSGICYGADEGLSAEAVSDFRTCGVSHLFAVSGLHMTVLLQGLLLGLRRFRIPRVGRALISCTLLLGFMAIVGFSASVVRAGVVSLIMLLGDCLRRQADARNSLGLALLILLIPDPFAAYDAGLLLSFTATFGLVCWTKPIANFLLRGREPKRLAKLQKAIAGTVAVSLAATLATLPVLAIYFGSVSLISVPANLLTTLPSEGVLIFGCLSSLFSAVGCSALAHPLRITAGALGRYVLWICEKFSAFSLATVAIEAVFLLLWLIGTYGVILVGRRVLGRQGLTALSGACVCILCIGMLLNRGAVHDVLRADIVSGDDLAVVLSYRGGTVAVIAPSRSSVLYGVRDTLQALGAAQLDALFVIGGEEPVVSHVPSMLDVYVTERTQIFCHDLPWQQAVEGIELAGHRVRLGESFEATLRQDQLLICWDEQTLLFTAGQEAAATDTADAVFGAGETRVWLRTETGLQPLSAESDIMMFKNEQWYIRSNR